MKFNHFKQLLKPRFNLCMLFTSKEVEDLIMYNNFLLFDNFIKDYYLQLTIKYYLMQRFKKQKILLL